MIGIDPGVTGAVCILPDPASRMPPIVEDLPILRVNSKAYVDSLSLQRSLLVYGTPQLIVIELAGVRPKQGISSSGQTMLLFGGIVATAMTVECPLELVAPAKWKRKLGLLGHDKEASRQKALTLFPSLADYLRRKKDHNRAEALLLGAWGMTVQ